MSNNKFKSENLQREYVKMHLKQEDAEEEEKKNVLKKKESKLEKRKTGNFIPQATNEDKRGEGRMGQVRLFVQLYIVQLQGPQSSQFQSGLDVGGAQSLKSSFEEKLKQGGFWL